MVEVVEAVETAKVGSDWLDTANGGRLTEQQGAVVRELLDWLAAPGSDFASRTRLIEGYAGTGKSFMLTEAIYRARQLVPGFQDGDKPDLYREESLAGEIVALAPTKKAVQVLRQANGGTFSRYQTIHSFLGLRPSAVTFGAKEEAEKERLEEKAKLGPLNPIEAIQLEDLAQRERDALSRKADFMPQNDKEGVPIVDKSVQGVRLLVVDEASMITSRIFSYLIEVLSSSEAMPDLQILFLGDPAQLPPVNEVESKALKVTKFTPLTEVVRNSGKILEYCTAVRTPGTDLRRLHPGSSSSAISPDSTLFSMPYDLGIDAVASEIRKDADSCRVLCSTNVAVRLANQLARREVHESQVLDYREGDELLTLAPVARDSYGNCTSKGVPIIGSREVVKIFDIRPLGWITIDQSGEATIDQAGEKVAPRDFVSFTRATPAPNLLAIPLLSAFWSIDEPGESDVRLVLLDPDFLEQYEELLEFYERVATSFAKQPKGVKKTETSGSAAAEACKLCGIKTRWHHHDGTLISAKEFTQFKKFLWRNFFKLKESCDRLSYSYASTAHSVQGETVDIVLIDMRTLFHGQNWSVASEKRSTWDIRRLLYTMASRARKQLIFLT